MKIYLAHQISGLTYDEVHDYYDDTSKKLKKVGFTVLCPMTGKKALRPEKEYKAEGITGFPLSTNHAIIERDRWMVSNCDVIFVNFEGTKEVSIGMTMELAWAHDKGKHSVVVLPEGNIHNHAFVREAADVIFNNYKEAIDYLTVLMKSMK